ncbi:alpha-1 2-glucosyltransferase-like [Tripterygium wilfordii]|uniref:Dol-P-Glc:Glc(2)Man(9)GlcNAc(2)-PP-Dol alpha-1,2-glucosyltransferase n=1 Tax=Tripterygium wilfordii TaxID=458696 RepID=A0A7J7C5G4_TRIWF|nr:alpha-1 2-glucosyltransferase-like [Tripterygium wilfordii]
MGALAVAAIICLWVIPISIIVNRIVPEPYMDEIFHIPQAQQYCRGNFKSWDPMITTPPGLYCLSIVHVVSLFPGMYFIQAVPSLLELCTSAVLRFTNGVLAVFCGILIYEIVTHLSPSLDKRKATVQAVVLALYPLHWFFTFLYYTDVASLTAVLAMYLACLRKKFHISALLGAVAVVIRQTNVVWVLFVVCTGVIDLGNERNKIKVDGPLLSNRETGHATMTSRITLGSNLKQRKSSGVVEIDNYSTSSQSAFLRTQSSGFLGEIQAIILKSWHIKWELLVSFSPFIIILVSFVAFVHWNGGVVLGAKEAHAVSPHLAQICFVHSGRTSCSVFSSGLQFSLLAWFPCTFSASLTFGLPSEYSIVGNDIDNFVLEREVIELFQQWKEMHRKVYKDTEEAEKRFQAFKRNLRYVVEKNSKVPRGHVVGLNKFADLSNEEFREVYLAKVKKPINKKSVERKVHSCEAPSSLDWRKRGVVTAVKNQR